MWDFWYCKTSKIRWDTLYLSVWDDTHHVIKKLCKLHSERDIQKRYGDKLCLIHFLPKCVSKATVKFARGIICFVVKKRGL